jgi:hypothetical protein
MTTDTHTPHQVRFALVKTTNGDAVLNVDDISHAVEFKEGDAHPAFGGAEGVSGVRVHFKAKGSTHLDLPGISPLGLASALNGAPF